MQGQSISRAVQERLGLPDTIKFTGPFPFKGMNQQASRLAIDDAQWFWLENVLKIGDGNLRSVPDIGPALFTSDARTIISFAWYSIGLFDYVAIFFSDGSALQVEEVSGTVTTIATPGSGVFYQPGGDYPATVGWGNIYLLISNNNTSNDYWAWDGTHLYGAGTIGPQVTLTASGSNYVGQPTITVFGGSGSGVVLSAEIVNGSVVAINVVAPGGGYTPGDTVQAIFSGGGSDSGAMLQANLQTTSVNQIVVLAGGHDFTSAPTVVITGGGGAGAAATASVFGGAVVSVLVTAGGTGFTSAPVISFTGGGGTGAQAQSTLVATGVDTISVLDGGTNYFGVPLLTLQGGFGSGTTATAVLSGPGPLASITIDPGGGGSGYTTVPTVTITDGGAGTGATAIVSQIDGGVVSAILLTDPGVDYDSPIVTIDPPASGTTATATAAVSKGSIASVTVDNHGGGYTDAPAVIVQPGLNSAASATLQLMPFGVSGSSMETYQSQVWIQYPFQAGSKPTGGVRLKSAPDSISDFATSSGGLEETVTDRFLRRHLVAIRQSNGFLYPVGDSSVGVISNVQISGDPPTATLTNQNTDPQTGTHWRDTMQDFSRTILFANKFGVFGLFGGAVTKVSGEMDNVFANALFPDDENPQPVQPPTPTAAVANLFNRKVYLLLISILDPFTRAYRPAMVCWTESDWSIISQSVALTYIGTQEVNSNLKAWGTDGRALYPLMQVPSERTLKIMSTKLYGAASPYMTKQARMVYMQAANFVSNAAAPEFAVTIDTEWGSIDGNVPTPVFPPPAGVPATETYSIPAVAAPPPVLAPVLAATTGDVPGMQLGLTISTAAADFSVYNLVLAYDDNQSVVFG